jgi:hypothetical protein
MAFYKKLATLFIASLANISMATPPAHPHLSSNFPRGCEASGFVFYKNFLVLNEHGNQTFYLIQNHSDQTVEFEHFETKTDAFMSPKLQAKVAPSHWSAFASDVAQLYFRCYLSQDEKRVPVNCANFLNVCQYPRVRFALSNQGSYWVSTDKEQAQVIKDASAKGIYLHW